MTTYRELLEKWDGHTVRCEYVTEVGWPCTCGFDEVVAYLAQPMTKCKGVPVLTEAVLLGALNYYGSHKITCTMKDADCTCGYTALLAGTSPAAKKLLAREGELVAALRHLLSEYKTWVKPLREAAGWPDGGPYWQEAECALAALAQGKKE